jgi:thioredoxin reductase (NADPH)
MSASAGSAATPAPLLTDALVIGAGPIGLWQAFQLGLLGLSCHIVDALPQAGGQCTALYPDKPIYDIPGLPVCTGAELIERLLTQVAPLAPQFHLGLEIDTLRVRDDGGFEVHASPVHGAGLASVHWHARSVFIAAGVGAFQPRRLKLPGAEALEGRQLHHHASEAPSLRHQHAVVLGGDDRALAWAIDLAQGIAAGRADAPASVTLLHRRDVYTAEPTRIEQLTALVQAGAMQCRVGQPAALQQDASGRLTGLVITNVEGQPDTLVAEALCVSLGLSPRLGPVSDWGLALDRKLLQVDTARFETSIAGVYAVGDIVSYPGKKKLIVSGFHEATLAAHAALDRLWPETPHPLQYTSSSALLQQRLCRPERDGR